MLAGTWSVCSFDIMLDPISTPDFTEPILDVANLQCYGDIISDILQDAEEKLSAMK